MPRKHQTGTSATFRTCMGNSGSLCDRGAPTAILYGGDISWKTVEVSADDFSSDASVRVHGAPVVGREGEAVILNESEMLWLTACWFASNIG